MHQKILVFHSLEKIGKSNYLNQFFGIINKTLIDTCECRKEMSWK